MKNTISRKQQSTFNFARFESGSCTRLEKTNEILVINTHDNLIGRASCCDNFQNAAAYNSHDQQTV